MKYSCCIRACHIRQVRKKKKPMLFKFPTNSDFHHKWLLCIGKRLQPTQNPTSLRICSEHFKNDDFQRLSTDSNTARRGGPNKRLKQIRLLPEAQPSIFSADDDAIVENVSQSANTQVNDIIMNVNDLKHKFLQMPDQFNFSIVDDPTDQSVWFLDFEFTSYPLIISHSVKVFPNLTFQAFFKNDQIPAAFFSQVMSYLL